MSVLKGFRENIDLEFNNSSNFVLKLAEEVGRTPPVPKLAKCWSRFRPNVDNDSSQTYYKRSVVIPFLDNKNSQLESSLKDRNYIEIFTILPSIMFGKELKVQLKITRNI